jgi:hypothetical protein
MTMKQIKNFGLYLIAFLLLFSIFFACFGCAAEDPEEIEGLGLDEGDDDNADDDEGVNCQVNDDGTIRYCVSTDSNSDGQINPGETVELSLFLTNQTSSDYVGATATVSTTSPYVEDIYYNSSETQNINAGQEVELSFYGDFQFTLADNTPFGEIITFHLDVDESQGNGWESEFSIEVVGADANIAFSRYVVSSDSNGDNSINNGEIIDLSLYVKNTGTSNALGVTVLVSTTSAYVEDIYYNSSETQNINAGQEVELSFYGDFQFTLADNTQIGETITFTLNISDGDGNGWQSDFSIEVVGTDASIAFSRYVVSSDSNDDNSINNGETIDLSLYVKNTGTSNALGVQVLVSTTSSYVEDIYYNSSETQNIDAGQEIELSFYGDFQFTLADNMPIGETITFNLDISDSNGNEWESGFSVEVVGTDASIAFSRYVVSGDSNDDNSINNGETIELSLYVKNTGTSNALGVTVLVSTSSPYADISYNSSSTENIDAGEEVELSFYGDFQFTLADNTPIGEIVIFNLDISDSHGNEWESEFSIDVVATGANIAFSRYVVSDDDSGNWIINPGETIDLSLYVENSGTSNALGVVVTVSTYSPHVEWIQDATSSTANINDGAEVELSFYGDFSFRLAGTTPAGIIDFDMDIEDQHGNDWQSQFSITVIDE